LADASPCSKWKELIANNVDWKKTRAEKKIAEKEEEEKIIKMLSVIVDKKLAGLQETIEAQGQMIKELQSQIKK